MLNRLLLYVRTARNLEPRQWIYFPLRRIQRRIPARNIQGGNLDARMMLSLRSAAEFLRGTATPDADLRARQILAGQFTFLNHTESLRDIEWKKTHGSALWNYNFHYFDYATDLAQVYLAGRDPLVLARLESLIAGWIAGMEDGKGAGWDSYPTSVRIINWVFVLLLLQDDLSAALKARMSESLFRQLHHLERRLEWNLLGNHLQKNFLALFIGGLVFDGAIARRWRRRGGQGLWTETAKQVLPDGGHEERSPMYHAIALGDLLEGAHLARVAGETVPVVAAARIGQMAAALGVLQIDRNSLHLLNDAAQCVAPPASHLDRVARKVVGHGIEVRDGAWTMPDTGYHGIRDEARGDVLIVDCGSPAPRHQPGHAHCGLLGYELILSGICVVVDSGVHGYDGDPFREYVRSTRAHSTVMIDGKDQSEMWGTFRVGRRAEVTRCDSRLDGKDWVFEGEYHPYHSSKILHRRTIRSAPGAIEVTDVVIGHQRSVESFVHLHPDVSAEQNGDAIRAVSDGLELAITPFGVDEVSLVKGADQPIQGWYCPEFGKALAQTVVVMRRAGTSAAPFGYRIAVVNRPT